jgi:[ribosomal protein S18]-alanine N-acetyltransferase
VDFVRYAQDPAYLGLFLPSGPGLLVAQQAGDAVEILTVAVHLMARRQGVGAALMQALLAAAPGARCLLDVAADNRAGIALYRRFGFVEVARRQAYYPHGADAVVMARPG